MNTYKKTAGLLLLLLITTLYGCGKAHVKTDTNSADLASYNNVLIKDINVYSKEANAENNDALQVKLQQWKEFSRNELVNYVNQSKYKLVKSANETTGKTLIADLDTNIIYGNRALRYFVGFGAGSGKVTSKLTIKDARTDQIKYQSTSESELSTSSFGGDMEDVLKDNIKRLIHTLKRDQK